MLTSFIHICIFTPPLALLITNIHWVNGNERPLQEVCNNWQPFKWFKEPTTEGFCSQECGRAKGYWQRNKLMCFRRTLKAEGHHIEKGECNCGVRTPKNENSYASTAHVRQLQDFDEECPYKISVLPRGNEFELNAACLAECRKRVVALYNIDERGDFCFVTWQDNEDCKQVADLDGYLNDDLKCVCGLKSRKKQLHPFTTFLSDQLQIPRARIENTLINRSYQIHDSRGKSWKPLDEEINKFSQISLSQKKRKTGNKVYYREDNEDTLKNAGRKTTAAVHNNDNVNREKSIIYVESSSGKTITENWGPTLVFGRMEETRKPVPNSSKHRMEKNELKASNTIRDIESQKRQTSSTSSNASNYKQTNEASKPTASQEQLQFRQFNYHSKSDSQMIKPSKQTNQKNCQQGDEESKKTLKSIKSRPSTSVGSACSTTDKKI